MVIIINKSGCVAEICEKLSIVGFSCSTLSDIRIVKTKYRDIFAKWRSEINENFQLKLKELQKNRIGLNEQRSIVSIPQKILLTAKLVVNNLKMKKQMKIHQKQLDQLLLKENHTENIFILYKSTLIGAFGEERVINVLADLPDKYLLYNDFRYVFDHPIYWKKNNQYIRSIQIDHLLISAYGIIIIETKNYSQNSWNRKMKSNYTPIIQVERANYIIWKLFRELCQKRIPIYNIIALNRPLTVNWQNYVDIIPIDQLLEKIRSKETRIALDRNDICAILDFLNLENYEH